MAILSRVGHPKMKSILLTGASGVIGIPLLIRLIKDNPSCHITGTYKNNRDFLEVILENEFTSFPENLQLIPYDLILQQTSSNSYDEIWHFATYGQPIKAINEAISTVNLNVNDVIHLIKLLKRDESFLCFNIRNVRRNSDATETDIPISNPQSRAPYTESKRLGEALLANIIPSNHIIFRICLVYSKYANQTDSRVMYQFIRKAVQEGSINMLDSGAARRQYCFVNDAVTMMVNIRNSALPKDSNNLGVWNIANPCPITIKDLAEIIAEVTMTQVLVPKDPGKSVLDALNKVSIVPDRYIKNFGDFKFTKLRDALPDIIEFYSQKTLKR